MEKTWRSSVKRGFEQIRDKRIAQAAQQVAGLIGDMHIQLNDLIVEGATAPSDIMRGLKESVDTFCKTAEGPTKWLKLVDFMHSALGLIVKRVEGDATAQHEAATRALVQSESMLQTERAEAAKLRAAAGSEQARAHALEGQIQAAHQKAAAELERVRTQLQVGETTHKHVIWLGL